MDTNRAAMERNQVQARNNNHADDSAQCVIKQPRISPSRELLVCVSKSESMFEVGVCVMFKHIQFGFSILEQTTDLLRASAVCDVHKGRPNTQRMVSVSQLYNSHLATTWTFQHHPLPPDLRILRAVETSWTIKQLELLQQQQRQEQ